MFYLQVWEGKKEKTHKVRRTDVRLGEDGGP